MKLNSYELTFGEIKEFNFYFFEKKNAEERFRI